MRIACLGAAAPLLLAFSVLAQSSTAPAAKSSTPPLPTAGSATKPGQPPPPAHPLTTEQAHELMALNGSDKIKSRMVDNVTAYELRLPPFVPQDVKDDIHTSFEKMDIDSQTVAIYQKYLSTEDASKIIDFYKTPAGKNLLLVTPSLMGDIQQNASKTAQTTLQATFERHKTEIETAQKSYEAAHPAPSLGPGTGSGTGSGTGATTPKKPQ